MATRSCERLRSLSQSPRVAPCRNIVPTPGRPAGQHDTRCTRDRDSHLTEAVPGGNDESRFSRSKTLVFIWMLQNWHVLAPEIDASFMIAGRRIIRVPVELIARRSSICAISATTDRGRAPGPATNACHHIVLDRKSKARLLRTAERWPSGRRRSPAKRVYGQKPYRGFESHPLRQSTHRRTAETGGDNHDSD